MKIQEEKAQKIKVKKGFVLLFAITIASIILAVALGVANIAYREVRFGTSAIDTNASFFAADTATEVALFNDKPPFTSCAAPGNCSFLISQLGSKGQGCAKVSITKTATSTTIIAKGYNNGGNVANACNPSGDAVEREIDTSY